METPKTLVDFYAVMNQTRTVRVVIVKAIMTGEVIAEESVQSLEKALTALEAIPHCNNTYTLNLDETRTIALELDYEIGELKKDLYFLRHTESEFEEYLMSRDASIKDEVCDCVSQLKDVSCKTFITDRDGTVNNYCGRYASSIQSVYNAVFLSRYASKKVENAVILTSAPLDKIGLVEISVNPANIFVYAGSKGREYFSQANERRQFPVEESKQVKLDELNARLSALVKESQYEKFSLIGSGLQFKFGQTTIARQDIAQTIPVDESLAFMHLVEDIVADIDPEQSFFRIEDTGKDVEVILTIEGDSEDLKDFDKGDGVDFLNTDIGFEMEKGVSLICGDTGSDAPMVDASKKISQETWAIFVTQDDALKERVRQACPSALFVSTPDALVLTLHALSKVEK